MAALVTDGGGETLKILVKATLFHGQGRGHGPWQGTWGYGPDDTVELAPVVRVARMMKDHLAGLQNYFEHRNTNAVADRLNSKITAIQKMAYGFRNKDHIRTTALFRCGGLKLQPVTYPNPG